MVGGRWSVASGQWLVDGSRWSEVGGCHQYFFHYVQVHIRKGCFQVLKSVPEIY